MGPALANNYHSKLQAERCLKRHASKCVPRFESSSKRRRLHSSRFVITSTPSQREKLSTQMVDCEPDGDYACLLRSLQANNGSNHMEDETDFDHKLFLEHLREDGCSYVLEMTDLRSNMPMFVKYELDDWSSDGAEIASQSSSNIHSNRRSTYVGVKGKKPCEAGPARHKQNRGLGPKSEDLSISSSLDREHKNGEPLQDDSYQVFINHIRLWGHSIILELNGFSVKYEEEDENLTAPERSSAENVSHQNELGINAYSTPYQPSDSVRGVNGGHKESRFDEKPSYFKRKLMKVINQPYNRQEHRDLWGKATERKAFHSQRILRTVDKSYPTARDSMSYLDYYPDLAEQIKSADKHGALTLLRGFFFWLKNLSHEGAFMPWATSPIRDRRMVPLASSEMTPIQIA